MQIPKSLVSASNVVVDSLRAAARGATDGKTDCLGAQALSTPAMLKKPSCANYFSHYRKQQTKNTPVARGTK